MTWNDSDDTGTCVDCDSYKEIGELSTMDDGRTVCSKCRRAAEEKRLERAQGELFGQVSMFEQILAPGVKCS